MSNNTKSVPMVQPQNTAIIKDDQMEKFDKRLKETLNDALEMCSDILSGAVEPTKHQARVALAIVTSFAPALKHSSGGSISVNFNVPRPEKKEVIDVQASDAN